MKPFHYLKTRLFSTARVIVIFWNLSAFFYHYFYIGIDGYVCMILQGSALIMEYSLTGIYERMIVYCENIIQHIIFRMHTHLSRGTKLLMRYLVYTAIFMLIYVSIYAIRLYFFFSIHWGVTEIQMGESLINMIFFSLIMGWLMGAIVVIRKNKISLCFFKLKIFTSQS